MVRGDFLLLVLAVLCVRVSQADECVIYHFEENYHQQFSSEIGICASFNIPWTLRQYAAGSLEAPNPHSSSFISPVISNQDLSCIASFTFKVRNGGFVEVLAYTENAENNDHILVMAESLDGALIGSVFHTSTTPGFVPGWTTLKLDINMPPGEFEGFLYLLGAASKKSTILVDSFRYVPPSIDERNCAIYGSYTTIPPMFTTVPEDITDSITVTESGTTYSTDIETSVTDKWTTVTTEDSGVESSSAEPTRTTSDITDNDVSTTPIPEDSGTGTSPDLWTNTTAENSDESFEESATTESTTVVTTNVTDVPLCNTSNDDEDDDSSIVTESWTAVTNATASSVSEIEQETTTTKPSHPSTHPPFWIKLKLKMKMYLTVAMGAN